MADSLESCRVLAGDDLGPLTVALIVTPKPLLGKALHESGLRGTYRLFALAIKSGKTGEYHFMPEANHVLQEGDVLVVLGREMDLARFSALE